DGRGPGATRPGPDGRGRGPAASGHRGGPRFPDRRAGRAPWHVRCRTVWGAREGEAAFRAGAFDHRGEGLGLAPCAVHRNRGLTVALYPPYIIERSSRGERTYDIFSRLLMDRIVFMGAPINDDVANIIIAPLLFLEADNPEKDIYLYINSPGAVVSRGMAIYDT